MLGQSYEYLIKKFADATNKKAGEFYTPRSVVRLMVNILDPREGESIYDPACGTGGMLIEAIHHVRETGGDDRTLWGKLFGQEKNLTTSAIARMNLFLHGASDFQVVRGDTLRQPAFFSGDSLATFDCVIANPPFSLEKWGDEVWAAIPTAATSPGMPPAKSGDYAWVQHMIKSMAPKTGRMAVVLPHGALFRMGDEGKIRQKILGMDILDAVIGLGPNLFYGTGLAACILVFRQKKAERPPEQGADRRCLEGIQEGPRSERTAPRARRPHLSVVSRTTRMSQASPGWSRSMKSPQNDRNLNIPRYVEPIVEAEMLSVADAIATLKTSARCRICGRGTAVASLSSGEGADAMSQPASPNSNSNRTSGARPLLLRGTIDAGDYKQFIFPLLFYKRLCDVFDEEIAQRRWRNPAATRRLPHFPRTTASRSRTMPIGVTCGRQQERRHQALQSAMRAIETANPDKLYGIFGDAQWTNKDRLSDAHACAT